MFELSFCTDQLKIIAMRQEQALLSLDTMAPLGRTREIPSAGPLVPVRSTGAAYRAGIWASHIASRRPDKVIAGATRSPQSPKKGEDKMDIDLILDEARLYPHQGRMS